MSAHLRNPQSAADVHPFGPTSGGLQGSSSLGAEQALWLDTQGTRPAQPAACGHLEDPIACLGREQGVMYQRHWPNRIESVVNYEWFQPKLQVGVRKLHCYQALARRPPPKVLKQRLFFACFVCLKGHHFTVL